MMLRHLGQADPAPPPVRPINWPMILGWTAVVGMTLAVFNGTISLSGGKVRANRRRRSSRRVRRNVGTQGYSKVRVVPAGHRAPVDGGYFLWAVPITKPQWERFRAIHRRLASKISVSAKDRAAYDAALSKLTKAGFDAALPVNVQFKGGGGRGTQKHRSVR